MPIPLQEDSLMQMPPSTADPVPETGHGQPDADVADTEDPVPEATLFLVGMKLLGNPMSRFHTNCFK